MQTLVFEIKTLHRSFRVIKHYIGTKDNVECVLQRKKS